MTEFEKAAEKTKQDAIDAFKKQLIAEIMRIYEYEYPTASGEFDEFYRTVLKIISES